MYPKIFHIYGPFELSSYGLALGVGLVVFVACVLRNPARAVLISKEDLITIATEATLSGIIGARILHVISDWPSYTSFWEILRIWEGGLSALGGILGALGYIVIFLKSKHIPFLSFLDLIAVYAPLMYSITRIGCFLSGCCYGQPTNLPWGVTYSHQEVVAPLFIKLHPTQLYSALFALFIYFILRTRQRKAILGSGEIIMLYLMLTSLERLLVDFLRGDRIMSSTSFLSFYQWISLALFGAAFCSLVVLKRLNKRSASI